MVSIKEVNYLFPLYLYDDDSLFAEAKGKRRPNVAPKFIEEITNKTNLKFQMDGKGDLVKSFGPEDVFNYVYCVLYSSSFRKKYSEYLKRDFARIPIPGNLNSFKDLSELGKRLVEMHTLSSMAKSEIKFPETGTDIIEIVKLEGNKIFINSVQYFENVANSTWEFHVGGYQVCEKWLKDRKGKKLNFNDIKTYQNILSNVLETTEVIKKIELVVKDYGGWPLS
jgi:predicted helicase